MKNFARPALVTVSCLIFALSSCKQSGDFSGGSNRAPATVRPPKEPQKEPPKPTQTAVQPTEQCSQTRLVGVKSLSTFIYQGSNSKQFDVELTFEPCPNQHANLALPVKFDLDAYFQFNDQGDKTIPYELLVNNSRQSNGRLTQRRGADLFGKSCQDCFFFQTDYPLEADPLLTRAILRLSLSSFGVRGPSNSSSPATRNFTVPLNIRVGDSPAVTGNLSFTPMGL